MSTTAEPRPRVCTTCETESPPGKDWQRRAVVWWTSAGALALAAGYPLRRAYDLSPGETHVAMLCVWAGVYVVALIDMKRHRRRDDAGWRCETCGSC